MLSLHCGTPTLALQSWLAITSHFRHSMLTCHATA